MRTSGPGASMESRPEGRRHPRSGIAASAAVLAGERFAGSFVVENVSAGGALLVGDPRLQQGDRVNILLQIHQRRPLSLRAEVVRQETRRSGETVFAVAFHNVPSAVEDTIQGAVLFALEQDRADPPPTILVVDDSRDVHVALERDLRALGRGAFAVATPLEAVSLLQDPDADVEVEVALVDLYLGHADGLDVLAFLAEERPEIRRVLMSGKVRLCQLELAVSSGRAHAALQKPWDRHGLREILA